MSDGSLSQEEIDSLLSGLDPGVGAAASPKAGAGLSSPEVKAFKEMLESLSSTQAQNLSAITGEDVTVQSIAVDQTNRDGMLPSLPDEVLEVRVDMSGGIPGDHFFLFPKDTAIKIAALANKDETLNDLDDMAISIVSECVSNITGTEITLFSEKSGNLSIQSDPAEGSFGPKAMARFPGGDFFRIIWELRMAGQTFKMWEVYAQSFVRDIVASSGMVPATQAMPSGGMGGMGGMQNQMGGMQGQMGSMQNQMGNMQNQMGGMQNQMGGMQGQMGGMQPGYGQQMYQQQGMGMQGMGMPGMMSPNVQPVQFANLGMGTPGQESGNIGLIMDVYMELTVELGRTKRLIKDILGIGEGTIIELDKLAGEPVDILVNHKPIAKGEVVVIDENFGVRVTEILSPMERVSEFN